MDFGCKLLVLVFTVLRLSKMASSDNNCLFSRLEDYPCAFRFPEMTQIAGPNQYGVYTTALDQDEISGRVTCVVRKRNHAVSAIPAVSDEFHIKSPNKYPSMERKTYRKNLLAIYNVHCPGNYFIYINLVDISLDDSACYDPKRESTKCVDYLQIRTAAGIVLTENCGNDIGELNGYTVTESSVEIIFRTDDKRAAAGFSATVKCFDPSACMQSQQWRSRASVETLSQSCPEAVSEKFEVPYGHSLYNFEEPEHQSLVLVEGRSRKIKATWPYERPLKQLRYYSMNGSMNEFSQQVSGRDQNARDKNWFPLKGPGNFYLTRSRENSRACYQDYSGVNPTDKQKQQINKISAFMRFMHEKQHHARSSGLQQSDVDSESYMEGDTVTPPLASHSKLINFLTSLEQVLLKHSVRKINNLLTESSASSESCNPILEAYKSVYKNTVKNIKLD